MYETWPKNPNGQNQSKSHCRTYERGDRLRKQKREIKIEGVRDKKEDMKRVARDQTKRVEGGKGGDRKRMEDKRKKGWG